jgi:hypothetical protein
MGPGDDLWRLHSERRGHTRLNPSGEQLHVSEESGSNSRNDLRLRLGVSCTSAHSRWCVVSSGSEVGATSFRTGVQRIWSPAVSSRTGALFA